MAITQYRPSADVFGPLFENFLAPVSGMNRMGGLLRAPEADVIETENDIQVVLDAPGLQPEEIDLSLESNVLTISGEKREERTEGDEGRTWHLSERRHGRFSRSFVLPRDVEPDGIQARFDNGVLHVRIPKSERARRRCIEIRGGNDADQHRQVEAQPSVGQS